MNNQSNMHKSKATSFFASILKFSVVLILVMVNISAYAQVWTNVGPAGFTSTSINEIASAIDGSNTPYVAYTGYDYPTAITVKKFNGSSWISVGSEDFTVAGSLYPSIAINAGGTPYVVYQNNISYSRATVMKFDGSDWIPVGPIGFSTGDANYTSIAINTSGTPYVVYADGMYGYKATVMKFDGSGWVVVGSPGFSSGAANNTKIAINNSGTPYVSFQDGANSNKATVMTYDGSNWITLGSPGFSAGQATSPAIALDVNGTPYVVYSDESSFGLFTVMKYNGSNWVPVGNRSFTSAPSGYADIAIDPQGVIYVAGVGYPYTPPTSQLANVMKFNGSSWETVGNPGFSPGIAGLTSLARGSDNALYISYVDDYNDGKASVMSYREPITGRTGICQGSTSTLIANTLTGGIWSSSNTTIATVGTSSGIVTGVSTGTSVISYVNGATVLTTIVTIEALPSAGIITGNSLICTTESSLLSDSSGRGSWTTSDAGIATVIGVGFVTGVAAGTATISYSVTNSCGTATATRIVTVNSTPVAGSITGLAMACPSTTTLLSNTSTGGVWNSGNIGIATVSSAGLVTGIALGTSIISYSLTNSCGTTTATTIITVNAYPTAGTITGTVTVCPSSNTTLSDASTGGAWTSGSTGIATIDGTGLVLGISPGTAVISYSVSSSCGTAVATQIVTVGATPSISGITGSSSVCIGASISLTEVGTAGAWTADNATATVSSSGVVTGVSAGTNIITYTSSTSCGTASTTHPISVSPPVVTGTITGPSEVCAGTPTAFSNTVTTGIWSVSSPIATMTPAGILTGISAGVVNVVYTVAGACTIASTSKTVTINPMPAAGIITGPTTVCQGSSTTIAETATGGIWSSANGFVNISPAALVTGVIIGIDTIKYTVSNSCGSVVARKTFTVKTLPSAGAITGSNTVCTGHSITLSNTLPGGVWSSGNGFATVSAGGVVTGLSSGADIISYTVTSLCGSASAVAAINVEVCGGTAGLADPGHSTETILNVSPNPGNGTFNVNIESEKEEIVHVTITNIAGSIKGTYNIPTNKVFAVKLEQPAGMYLLSAVTSGGVYTAKIVIQ